MPRVDLTDEDREVVERVRACFERAKEEHDTYRTRWGGFYALYRGYQDWQTNNVDRRDRDDRLRSAKKEWGAALHIPITFRTVETVAPRITGHRLASYILPRDRDALGNVDNMRTIVDFQQEQCNYPLTQQDVAKDGLMYALGVQKTFWRSASKKVRVVKEAHYKTGQVEDTRDDSIDDPWAEWVDPFDFLWDPSGHSVETCSYLFHRTWRPADYIAKMVATGKWTLPVDFTLEDLLVGSPTTKQDEIWQSRRQAEGQRTDRAHGDHFHEIWEYHNGGEVITILDSEVPVRIAPNPTPDGSKPFQVYRPTSVPGRMVGIGEIEPIMDLQLEINTLRGQRRDAATMALGRGYAFDETQVAAEDLKIGPNLAIPVNGSPRDFLMPLPIADVPASGYQEEDQIKQDIDATSGISEAISGASSQDQTATGAQLSFQAAGRRIDNKRDRFVREIVLATAAQFVAHNQARIADTRDIVVPDGMHGWMVKQLSPNELRGRFACKIDDDASKAENVPQDRNDAQALMAFVGNPAINQQKLLERVLEKTGIPNAQGWVSAEQQIPASAVEQFLGQLGVPPEAFAQFMQQAQGEEAPDGSAQPQDPAVPPR